MAGSAQKDNDEQEKKDVIGLHYIMEELPPYDAKRSALVPGPGQGRELINLFLNHDTKRKGRGR
jgi:hypothetical protein